MRFVSDSFIALFSHFVPCGAWVAVFIIDGLLRNDSEVQPDTIHADTQGQHVAVSVQKSDRPAARRPLRAADHRSSATRSSASSCSSTAGVAMP